jgi:hypothetical protein
MPKLTINYSESLQRLIRAGRHLPIDGVEVGPWFSVVQIERARRALPELPFHLHMGSLVSRVRYWPGTINRLERYLCCTENEWLSLHIELLPLARYVLGTRVGIYLDPPGSGRAVQRFVGLLDRVRAVVDLPVILENLASLPVEKYHYAADPAVLVELLALADCRLLLDLAHARLAAGFRGQPVEEYVSALPLERVQQIHVSGIRRKDCRWYDAHDSLQEEDYRLLEWTLERCTPTVVTLEYFRQEVPLRQQIERLGEMLSG